MIEIFNFNNLTFGSCIEQAPHYSQLSVFVWAEEACARVRLMWADKRVGVSARIDQSKQQHWVKFPFIKHLYDLFYTDVLGDY